MRGDDGARRLKMVPDDGHASVSPSPHRIKHITKKRHRIYILYEKSDRSDRSDASSSRFKDRDHDDHNNENIPPDDSIHISLHVNMTGKAVLLLVLFSRWSSCLSFNPALPKQAAFKTRTDAASRPSSLQFVRLYSRTKTTPFSRNLECFETTPEGADPSSDDKESMAKAYNLSTVIFGFISVLLLLCPDKTLTKRLASKFGGAAGFGLASGASYILAGANEHDQLTSDTYKRLNLGVLGFSVLGLAGVPGEAAFFTTAAPAMFTSLLMLVTRIVGALVAYQGWIRGITSGLTPVQELVEGMKSNIRGLKVKRQDKKKSLAYRNCMLLVMFGMFSNLMGGIFDVRVSNLVYNDAVVAIGKCQYRI
jgi:hypothetical protein